MSVEPARTSTSPEFCAVRVAQRSDVGRVRAENQDHSAIQTAGGHRALLIVADGMGGHRGGATASRLATQTLIERLDGLDPADPSAALREAFVAANETILQQSQQSVDLRGMGTTCSAMLILDGRAWIGHVGDSRIYRVRDGVAEQLTADHSLVASMVREGLLSQHEADVHPRRNVLQRSVGVIADVEIDVSEPIDVQEGDTFILCSDGLHGLVRPEEMVSELEGRTEEEAAERLVNLALERGAPDNVTVIVSRAERQEVPSSSADASGSDGASEPQRGSGWTGWVILLALVAAAVVGILMVVRGDW